MLFVNGRFFTDKGFREAVYVEGGIIRTVGRSVDLLRLHPGAEIIDLEKKTVVPGFNDSHLHVLSYSRFLESVNLRDAKTKEEIIRRGREALGQNSLVMYGYDDGSFPRPLSRFDLDLISTEIPIVAYRSCGHVAAVNGRALALLPESEGIDIENGILKENALSLLEGLKPQESKLRLKERIKNALSRLNAYGITSVGTNDVKDDLETGLRILEAYRELEEEGELSARVSLQFAFTEKEKIAAFLEERRASPFFRLGPLKLFLDGSLGGETALLSEPYTSGNWGIQTLGEGLLEELLGFAEEKGLQVGAHAIGDAASALFLSALRKQKQNRLRHFLIHLQVLRPDLLACLRELQVPAALQPIFIAEDMEIAKRKLSKHLLKTSYCFKSISEATVSAFGSDAPYGEINPFRGLQAALTQENEQGEVLHPEERVTREEALKCYTENSAYLTFEEGRKGRIAPGQYGDFVVLCKDYFSVPEKEISELKAELTVVGGRIVHRR